MKEKNAPENYINTVKEQAIFELIRMLGIRDEELDVVSGQIETWVMSNKSAADPSGSGKVDLCVEMYHWINAIKKLKSEISPLLSDART